MKIRIGRTRQLHKSGFQTALPHKGGARFLNSDKKLSELARAVYAVQMGYSLKTPVRAYVFADNAEISTPAFHEVVAMQWTGIIRAKDGNRFEPQAAATRAEVSAVLRRFVEVTVDPGTALGWGRNDSGRWLYY